MLLEVIADVCTACADSSPSVAPTLAGDVGSPTVVPPPGGEDGPGDGSAAPGADAQPGDEPSWWDSLFDSGKPAKDDGSHDVAGDVIANVGQDVATEIALDVAATRLPWTAGVLGVIATLVGASETGAKGATVIIENDGRGMGGSSKSGKAVWDALDQEFDNQRRGR